MTAEERDAILQELARLYRLRDEGKHVETLIAKLEEQLFGAIDEDQ